MKAKGFFLGLVLAASFIFLQFGDFSEKIIGDGGDNYEYFSFQYLVKEKIADFKYPLGKTTTLRYPVGFDLGSGYDGVFAVFTGATLGLVVPQPIAYNLIVLLILALNFFLAYYSVKKIFNDENTAISGGVFFGLSPFVFARINSHLNLAFIGGFPYLVYAFFNLYQKTKQEKISFKDIFLLFLAILLVTFGSLQYLILLSWFLIIFGVFLVFLKPKTVKKFITTVVIIVRKNFKDVFISGLVFFAIFLFFYGSYLKSLFSGELVFFDKYPEYLKYHLPALSDVFFPNQYLGNIWKKINHSSFSIEKVVSIGISGWLFFLLLFSKVKKQVKAVMIMNLVVLTAFSLSFIKLPLLPEGGRWTIIFSLFLIILAGQAKLFKNKKIFVPLLALFLIERLFFSIYSSPLFPKEVAKVIKDLPGKAVLNIPLERYNSKRSSYPYFFGKSIVDGYFHYTADTDQAYSFMDNELISKAICNPETKDYSSFNKDLYKQTISLLKENEIRTVLVHTNTVTDKYFYDECANVRSWWKLFIPETLILNQNTGSVKAKTFEITSSRPTLRIFFKKAGSFTLNGLLIYPKTLTDVQIKRGNEIISTQWTENESGLATSSDPVTSINVDLGEIIYISSEMQTSKSSYFTIYYQYSVDEQSAEANLPVEEVYQNSDYTVYTID